MKQTLVIGSTVIDVYLSVPALPRQGSDINILSQKYCVGGCAYNVYKTLALFGSPALLCSPVGSGMYGRMVDEHLRSRGIEPFVTLEEENGCCYCLIEPDGERSFLSLHGAEYLFSRSWLNGFDFSTAGSIFICGLELEERSGDEIVNFVYENPELELFFAPGPRLMHIGADRMERVLCRRDSRGKGPLLHLSHDEAVFFAGSKFARNGDDGIIAGAENLARKTRNSVVVTLGARGCYCLKNAENKGLFIDGFPARVVDTVGAGDAHCGALIACLKQGIEIETACLEANKIGAALVSKQKPYSPGDTQTLRVKNRC